MNLTKRELMVIELALINRCAFLTKNTDNVPGAPEKLAEAEALRNRVAQESETPLTYKEN